MKIYFDAISQENCGGGDDRRQYCDDQKYKPDCCTGSDARHIHGVIWHNVKFAGDVNVGSTLFAPATLTAQYHFHIGNHFKPYIGASPHMALILSDKEKGSIYVIQA